MYAHIDFASERRLIEASDNPREILDWISQYRQHALAAGADEDSSSEQQFDDLIEFAMDQVVELKAAPLREASRDRAGGGQPLAGIAEASQSGRRSVANAAVSPPTDAARSVDPDAPARAERARRHAAEQAAAQQAAEEAEAEEQRLADEDLRVLRERAAKAKARKESAEREAARIEADAKRAVVEAERARRGDSRRRAAKEVEDAERTAVEAEAGVAKAATAAAKASSGRSSVPTSAAVTRPVDRPVPASPAEAELTPLGRLFQQRLADVLVARPALRPASPPGAAPAPSQNRDPSVEKSTPARATVAAAPPKEAPAAVPLPPPDPVDALPPLTGAELTSYRTWLGVSQRALAIKFAVEQSVISKSEGKPTTVLPPQLRKALHQAMGEPRPDVGGAP